MRIYLKICVIIVNVMALMWAKLNLVILCARLLFVICLCLYLFLWKQMSYGMTEMRDTNFLAHCDAKLFFW